MAANEEARLQMIRIADVIEPQIPGNAELIDGLHRMVAALRRGDLAAFLVENERSAVITAKGHRAAEHASAIVNEIRFVDPETFDDAYFTSQVTKVKLHCADQTIEWLRHQLDRHSQECTKKECSSHTALRELIAEKESPSEAAEPTSEAN